MSNDKKVCPDCGGNHESSMLNPKRLYEELDSGFVTMYNSE